MRANIDVDDELPAEAAEIAGTTTRKSTVETALRELIRQHKVRRVIELWGSFDWDGDLQEVRRSRFQQSRASSTSACGSTSGPLRYCAAQEGRPAPRFKPPQTVSSPLCVSGRALRLLHDDWDSIISSS